MRGLISDSPTEQSQIRRLQHRYNGIYLLYVLGVGFLLPGLFVGLRSGFDNALPLFLLGFGGLLVVNGLAINFYTASWMPITQNVLFEQNNDAVFIYDLKGRLITCNERACEVLGYTRDELERLSVRDVIADSEVPETESILTRLQRGETIPIYERVARRKNGETFPVEVNVQMIFDNAQPLYLQSIVRDVSERRAAEQALRESEERLRTFAHSLPDQVSILNYEGRYNVVLRSDNIGTDTVGQLLRDLHEPTFANFALTKIRQTIDETRPLVFEYKYPHENESRFFEGRTVPYSDPNTGEKLAIWIARDITEQKRLEEHEQNLGRIMENSLNEIYIFDANDLCFLLVNRGARENLGYSMDELRQMTPINIKPEYSLEAFNEKIQPLKRHEKEKIVFSTIHQRKNQSTYPVEVHLQLSTYQSSPAFIAMILDITERQKADEELRKSQERLAHAQRIGRIGNWERDVRTGSLYWSDEIFPIFGVDKSEVKDISTLFWESVHPEDRQMVTREREKSLETGRFSFAHRIILPSGEIRHLHEDAEMTFDEHGEPLLLLGTVQDITDRVHVEEGRMALALETEKVQFLREFLDTMTHDLRTPITVISTSLHLLERSRDEQSRSARMGVIREQINILNQMIEDMLSVTRLDSLPSLELISTDISELLGAAVEQLRPQAEHKNIEFVIDVKHKIPNIQASQPELRSAFTNLIENAIKYTPDTGTVNVQLSADDDRVVLEVRDTGIGINKHELKHVFERFYRSDNARSAAIGTGLGLAITKRVIELHGGVVEAQSTINEGSTFRIRLPIM